MRKCEQCGRSEEDGFELRESRETGLILCSKHRTQLRRHGKFLDRTRFDKNEIIVNHERDFAEIILYNRQGLENARTIINIDDIEKINGYKWSIKKKNNNFYVRTTVNKKDILLHKLLTNTDSHTIVDHIDRNTLNNKKSNLRIASCSQNGMNKSIQSNNSSGFTGVYYSRKYNKWISTIKINKKTISLGMFLEKVDAIKFRLNAEKKYFKEFTPQKNLFEEYGIKDDEKDEI